MALSVNKVLTATYHAAYSDAIEGDELVLLTAPLAATTEVEALFTAGVIDIESALPAALHSLGASAVEIDGALKRRREADKSGTDTKLMEAQTAAQLGDADVQLKAAQTAKTNEEVLAVRAGVKKTEATRKSLHDGGPVPERGPPAAGRRAAKVTREQQQQQQQQEKDGARACARVCVCVCGCVHKFV